MRPVGYSVRPPFSQSRDGGGLIVKAEDVGVANDHRAVAEVARAVFPVGETSDNLDADDVLCSPCEEEEQAVVPATLPAMYQPTHSEYLDHCVTHYPFRAWCKHCLEGRGREFGHDARRGNKDVRATPVVSFDYAFLSDCGDVESLDDFVAAGDAACKVLVVRDSKSKSVFAHVVPSKGVDEAGFAVDALVEDVKWLGYSKLTLKSDNEPAIVKLLTEALRELRVQGIDQLMEEHSPEYDPQANGSAEVAVRLLKGHLRTLRSCLESRIGFRVPVNHSLTTWLVRHAAALVTWCAKGHDGQTAYQRVRGREFRVKLMSFGECCSFKIRSHEPVASQVDGRRFHQGVFIGIDRRTGQYMVYSDDEVKLARTVVRVPESEKWNKDMLAAVKLTPLSLHLPREGEIVFKDKIDVERQEYVDQPQIARNVYLRPSDFEDFGFTRGCARCDHFRRHDAWGTRPHSKLCRDRITMELSKTAAGRTRIGAAAERLDRTVEELGSKFREDLPQGGIADVVVQPRSTLMPSPNPAFLPLDGGFANRADRVPMDADNVANESGEVPPPTDEPGRGETRISDDGPRGPPTEFSPAPDLMDVNIADSPDTDLSKLLGLMHRDERIEIENANREILSVIKSLGGNGGK